MAGCEDLLEEVAKVVKPKLHVFGHIHEGEVRDILRRPVCRDTNQLVLRFSPHKQFYFFWVRLRGLQEWEDDLCKCGNCWPWIQTNQPASCLPSWEIMKSCSHIYGFDFILKYSWLYTVSYFIILGINKYGIWNQQIDYFYIFVPHLLSRESVPPPPPPCSKESVRVVLTRAVLRKSDVWNCLKARLDIPMIVIVLKGFWGAF